MKTKLLIIVTCLITFNSFSQRDKIVGKWKLENKLDIEIYEKEGFFFGKIIALNGFNDGQLLDEHNSDKKLRGKSLIGLVLMKNLEYNKEKGVWEDGEMYAPHMGIKANLEIKKVEGKVLTAVGSKLFFWHTEEWIKIID